MNMPPCESPPDNQKGTEIVKTIRQNKAVGVENFCEGKVQLRRLRLGEDSALLPSLLTLSDVFCTGHHAAVTAGGRYRGEPWLTARPIACRFTMDFR